MTYGEDKTKEFISRIRKILITKPDVSIQQVHDVLVDNGIKLHRDYISKLIKKIRREKYSRYNNATAKKAIAEFEDFISATSEELLKISKTSKVDMAKIIALDTRVKHFNMLLEKQFDAGVFERHAGTLDVKYTNVAQVLKLLKDEREQQRKLKSANNRRIVDVEPIIPELPGAVGHSEGAD